MHLQVLIEETGKTFNLQPGKEYVAGSQEDCDIHLSQIALVAAQHLKFSYTENENVWRVQEISGTDNTFINGKPLSQFRPITLYPIGGQTRISIQGSVLLIATPSEPIAPITVAPLQERATPSSVSNTLIQPNTNTQIQSIELSKVDSGLTTAMTSTSTVSSFIDTIGKLPTINLGFRWFKIGAPEDGIGLKFRGFTLRHTYRVEDKNTNLDRICDKLYARVYRSVNDGTLGDAKTRPLIYRKNAGIDEDIRKYILITRDTMHGNRTTVLVRFLEYGENLYVGLDVYSLGQLSWLKLLKKVVITAVLMGLSFLLIPLFIIPILWWKLVWRAIYEKRIWLAVRQEFPGQIGGGPFDFDDVFMFSKSTVNLVTKTIREVFEEEGLPVEDLNTFIQQINNVTNVSTEGGAISMIGSALGAGNKIE